MVTQPLTTGPGTTAAGQHTARAAEVRSGEHLPGVDIEGLLSRLHSAPETTVVVPVHNGGPAVERCLAALVRHTRNARLVVIDDASTDPEVLKVLAHYASSGALELVRHDDNQGYTRTANHAFQLSTPADVVLLNSDTEVGPCWLQRLRWVAYAKDYVATVTAVSDNAGAMAVPVPGRPNAWGDHLPWEEVARFATWNLHPWSIEVPTGNGFCMYVRRAAIDTVGPFDATAFPRGYGEENDWCMRAREAGLTNLIAPHVLVRHARAQSFGSARDDLVRAGRAVIDRRHPTYTDEVRGWMAGPEMTAMRREAADVRRTIAARTEVRPRRLYVLHRGGGGTPATNRDLLTELEPFQDSYLLESSGGTVDLSRWENGATHRVLTWRPDAPFSVVDSWRLDYATFLVDVLIGLGFETIHVRHLIKQPLTTLPRVARLLGVPLVLSTHDFYYVCPTVHLLDEQDRYCGGSCTPGDGACRLPTGFVMGVPPLKHQWVNEWRRRATDVLMSADAVVATTESAATVYSTVFGEKFKGNLRVIEHGRDLGPEWAPVRESDERLPGPLRIMAPANWAAHKGIEYLRELARRVGPVVEWHIIGQRSEFLGDVGIAHGEYGREGLRPRAEAIDPDLVGLFSIWSETYSHTLSEAWGLGIPVVATDVGAVADRVRRHGGGVLLPLDHLDDAARIITSLAGSPAKVASTLRPVPRESIRSRRTMADDYRQLYEEVTRGGPVPSAAYIVRGRPDAHAASTHVRILPRIAHQRSRQRAMWRMVDPSDLINGADATPYHVCLVQRDALSPELVEPFLETIEKSGIRLAVEIDDDLSSRTARAHLMREGYDSERLDGVVRLLTAADVVVTSTDSLATSLWELTDRVVVVPNCLDPRLWRSEVTALPPPATDEVRILYMGSKTHGEDLRLLREAVPAVAGVLRQNVVLEVVGITEPAQDESWFRRFPIPPGGASYPRFVPWLRTHAHRWSAAVAPLVESSRSGAKSDLKLLEYAMLGLPTVASHVGPYGNAGHLARLASNDCASFASALVSVLQNPIAAQVQAGRARDWVIAHRMLTDAGVDAWCDAVLGSIGVAPGSGGPA
ncbi:glycosyltransferase [Actinopolymorpha sp. B9G3]|uniref:glycosyltransferase n=1 Tax=Actinopolymorpha sp. B9G3 TaxID=3158970 RepID=UPI0032D939FC